MTIKVHIDGMKEAEHFSNIVRQYSAELTLNAGKFCVDPKSSLGVLALLYSAHDNIELNTGDMEDATIPVLINDIAAYIKK